MTAVGSMVTVDRASPVPLYFQLAQELRRLIESGELPAGSRLENEIDLADQLGVSRPTMRRAIGYLVERGLLVRKRGVGTQVVKARVHRPLDLSSLFDDLSAAGRHPETSVLDLSLVAADEHVATALQVPVGTEVQRLERLRRADGEPLALLVNWLPLGVTTLDRGELGERGLYQVMRSAGVHFRLAEQSIGARLATPAESRLLNEPRGAALLTMTRTTYDDVGRPVEHGSHVYRSSRYDFALTLVDR